MNKNLNFSLEILKTRLAQEENIKKQSELTIKNEFKEISMKDRQKVRMDYEVAQERILSLDLAISILENN